MLLETVRPCPAYVLRRTSEILASNPEGLALCVGLSDRPRAQAQNRSLHVLHPAARELFDNWQNSAAVSVANLRSRMAEDPDAADLATLVAPGSTDHDALTLLSMTTQAISETG